LQLVLDRAERVRADTAFLEAARRATTARFVLFSGGEALLKPSPPIAACDVPGGVLQDLRVELSESVLLGLEGELPWFAVDVGPMREAVVGELARWGRFAPLGSIQDPIDGDSWSVLAQARALLAWNARARFCPACGSPTETRNGGSARACTASGCGALQFPRCDPAVIVRVVHDERCLLARQPSFAPRLRSVLAGFAEPGESLEAAVAREVEEEVGLHLASLSYAGSQPWPFPSSLMVGFSAEAAGDAIRLDDRELESAEWYTRARMQRELRDASLVLPSLKSIARRLIDDWLLAQSECG
jgi:NAD+ diphosphatase